MKRSAILVLACGAAIFFTQSADAQLANIPTPSSSCAGQVQCPCPNGMVTVPGNCEQTQHADCNCICAYGLARCQGGGSGPAGASGAPALGAGNAAVMGALAHGIGGLLGAALVAPPPDLPAYQLPKVVIPQNVDDNPAADETIHSGVGAAQDIINNFSAQDQAPSSDDAPLVSGDVVDMAVLGEQPTPDYYLSADDIPQGDSDSGAVILADPGQSAGDALSDQVLDKADELADSLPSGGTMAQVAGKAKELFEESDQAMGGVSLLAGDENLPESLQSLHEDMGAGAQALGVVSIASSIKQGDLAGAAGKASTKVFGVVAEGPAYIGGLEGSIVNNSMKTVWSGTDQLANGVDAEEGDRMAEQQIRQAANSGTGGERFLSGFFGVGQ